MDRPLSLAEQAELNQLLAEYDHSLTRRDDHFGLERRQLALWGLARIALFHNIPEAYVALWVGLEDRRADVRATAADLILDVYLGAQRLVSPYPVLTTNLAGPPCSQLSSE